MTTSVDPAILEAAQRACPHCGAGDIVKNGKRDDTQVYLCKPCGKTFTANGALPGRRVSPQIVADAMSVFYEGLSIRDVVRRVEALHGFKPSTATIYEWVAQYTRQADEVTQGFKADTGQTWVADEMVIRADNRKLWLWSVMDAKSRYVLATHLSETRTIKDAEKLFRDAKSRSTQAPKQVITDGLAAYIDGIERVFGGDTKHTVAEGIRFKVNNNLIERLNGTWRERVKVMRGFDNPKSADLLIDGFRINYNHMRPHMGIGNKRPAQAAGIPVVFEDWLAVTSMMPRDVKHLKEMKTMTFKTRPVVRERKPRLAMGFANGGLKVRR